MVMVAIGGYHTLEVFLRVYEKNAKPVVVVPAVRSRKSRRKSTKRTKKSKKR
jgi:hypothetical protein